MSEDYHPYQPSAKILVVDDDAHVRRGLQDILDFDGYATVAANDGKTALEILEREPIDLMLLDLQMPRLSGMDVLRRVMADHSDIPVIIVSGKGTIRTAVEATKLGAYDFLEKPIDAQRVLLTVRNAWEKVSLLRQHNRLLDETRQRYGMIGTSSVMQEVYRFIDRAAMVQSKVLVTGESGTGKEVVAHAIHQNSARKTMAFVEVNCAAVSEDLIESEFFGHEKGSFTGAYTRKTGKFEQADGGTIFLDEVGDMSLRMQAKVLRVLQEGRIVRVGGNTPICVDVRVVAATNQDLEAHVAAGDFREDLYYRLNVLAIDLPPLCERREDIPDLARYFLHQCCRENSLPVKVLDRAALSALVAYDWPGNVREMRNVIERLVVFSDAETIPGNTVQDLFGQHASEASEAGVSGLREARDQFERTYIIQTLITHDWKIQDTAVALGIDRSHLWKKMKRYGIQ